MTRDVDIPCDAEEHTRTGPSRHPVTGNIPTKRIEALRWVTIAIHGGKVGDALPPSPLSGASRWVSAL